MSEIDIRQLFDESRFPSSWKLIALLVYTPVGIILVLLRLLIGLHLWLIARLLPDCESVRVFMRRAFTLTFGIIVNVDKNGQMRDKKSRIIIANSISALDHFVLYQDAEAVTPSLWDLPQALSNAMGLQKMNMSSKDALVMNIKKFLASASNNIALQPEFGLTNSRVALLKFNSWPFGIKPSVQPVVLQAKRPELGIKLTSITSTWWMDVFWFMYVPYTIFTLTYLKVAKHKDAEILARQVEKDIAEHIGIRPSNYTVADKTEYEKRYVLEKTQSGVLQSSTIAHAQITSNTDMRRMARQVREVFPLVPYNVILRDLLETRSVDVTISNILEGVVAYTPELAPVMTPPCTSTSTVQTNQAKSTNNASTLSFQERKNKMIAEARSRYIQKHGLPYC